MRQKFALIGHPLTHSISSKIHTKLYEHFHMDAVYEHRDTAGIQSEINSMKNEGVSGFNITIPYKNDIIPFLDRIEEDAAVFGAVNTVKIENGKLCGYNTDAAGFLKALSLNGISFQQKKVILLGAGGACRSLAYLLAKSGAGEIVLLNRTINHARKIIDLTKNYVPSSCFTLIDGTFCDQIEDGALIINTTPMGMFPETNSCPVSDFSCFNETHAVADLIYNPSESIFLKHAKQRGAKIMNGLPMLILQAFAAFTIWTGKTVPDEIYFDIMEWLQ